MAVLRDVTVHPPSLLSKIAVALVSTVLTLLAVEGAFRIHVHLQNRGVLATVGNGVPLPDDFLDFKDSVADIVSRLNDLS